MGVTYLNYMDISSKPHWGFDGLEGFFGGFFG